MSLRALLYRRPSEPQTIQIVFDQAVYPVRIRRHRQARRYTLRIHSATREIILTMPPRGSVREAKEFAQKHGGWIAERLHRLNIVPSHILNAAIALVVGVYLLRSVRRWLDAELLPKSGMDPGMRMSLVTLFSNLGYVVLVLLILSLLGVKWSNLAWIVSALSVWIGFGLQEIVKNFVSGLILLTERPVKVGDMISISGVEGDIRRINVRATEIQLSDRSTVIVPNSQLISQNLRNVTMGNSTQGVATLMLTFPLNTDPEQIREILLSAYQENPAILDKPAPSVTFSQLTPDGITLSVTGYVSSPRISGSAKSELLFEILKRLRAAEITLSTPQMMMIQNVPHPGA